MIIKESQMDVKKVVPNRSSLNTRDRKARESRNLQQVDLANKRVPVKTVETQVSNFGRHLASQASVNSSASSGLVTDGVRSSHNFGINGYGEPFVFKINTDLPETSKQSSLRLGS